MRKYGNRRSDRQKNGRTDRKVKINDPSFRLELIITDFHIKVIIDGPKILQTVPICGIKVFMITIQQFTHHFDHILGVLSRPELIVFVNYHLFVYWAKFWGEILSNITDISKIHSIIPKFLPNTLKYDIQRKSKYCIQTLYA